MKCVALAAVAVLLVFASSAAAFSTSEPPAHGLDEEVHKSKLTCSKCEMYAGLAVAIISHPQSWNSTIHMLEGECHKKLANKSASELKDCLLVVKIIDKVGPWIVKNLEHLAWNIPVTLCADIVKVCHEPCCSNPHTPEQIFLSYADQTDLSQMRVTWVTLNQTHNAVAEFWKCGNVDGEHFISVEHTRTYTAGGWLGVIHSAVMTGLESNTSYCYHVGLPEYGWSDVHNFTTLPSNIGTSDRPLRTIMLADMGFGPASDDTVARITDLVNKGEVDIVLHPGDISYADGDEHHWDKFLNKIQPIASRVPYMTGPGNHEFWWNFTAYKTRLQMSMPLQGENGIMHFALRLGTVQFVMLNSETWIDTADFDKAEQAWAADQFNAASANRKAVPWIVSLHHRPLYCTSNKMQCEGWGMILRSQMEGNYARNRVDLNLCGHMHNYERTWPTVWANPQARNYSNPDATVYVTNGAAGNREGNSDPTGDRPWSAFHSRDVGFSRIDFTSDFATGKHDMSFRFIRSKDNSVLDQWAITKNM